METNQIVFEKFSELVKYLITILSRRATLKILRFDNFKNDFNSFYLQHENKKYYLEITKLTKKLKLTDKYNFYKNGKIFMHDTLDKIAEYCSLYTKNNEQFVFATLLKECSYSKENIYWELHKDEDEDEYEDEIFKFHQ